MHQIRSAWIVFLAVLLTGCFGVPPDGGDEATRVSGAPGPTDYGPPVPPGEYRFEGSYSKVIQPGVLKELPFEMTFLPSALDGVDIQIGLWRPDVPPEDQVPVIVDAGPYYGNNGPPMEERSGHLGRLAANYVPHGYAVAAVAVRGTGGSGGCMDLMGPMEVADLSQAITWLGEQAWSNGRVGMVGKSYDGSTPWQVASTGNPYLKTIVPVSGVPDLYNLMFRNGSSELRGSFLLNALYYSFAVREQANPPGTADEAVRLARHTAEGLPCPDHAVGLGAAVYSGTYGERDPTGYWAARNLKPAVEENYDGSVLLVQGLQDWNVDPGLNLPWADELNRSGLFVHQMLGQWGHDYPDQSPSSEANKRWDWAEILLRWFDYWLKGDTRMDLGPPVQVLDTEDRWRFEAAWPPRDATWLTFYPSEGGVLTSEPGDLGDALLIPNVAGPAGLAMAGSAPGYRADFYTEPQGTDLLISGLPKIQATVTPAGPVGHIAAWLYDVDEQGGEDLIGWAMLNLLFADGSEQAQPLTPGTPVVARMEVQPMDAVVEAGHRLLLRVWQYRDDPPGDPAQGRAPPPTAPITLEYGGSVETLVEIPTVERGPESYFEIPRSE